MVLWLLAISPSHVVLLALAHLEVLGILGWFRDLLYQEYIVHMINLNRYLLPLYVS